MSSTLVKVDINMYVYSTVMFPSAAWCAREIFSLPLWPWVGSGEPSEKTEVLIRRIFSNTCEETARSTARRYIRRRRRHDATSLMRKRLLPGLLMTSNEFYLESVKGAR